MLSDSGRHNDCKSNWLNDVVVVVKLLLFIYFAFIFVRANLCLKLNVAAVLVRGGGAGVRL